MSETLKQYVTKSINIAISKSLSPTKMQKIADSTALDIKRRTRLGFGVHANGAKRKRLKRLSDKYIARRRATGTHDETSPKKSNLTYTGQLLNSLKAEGYKKGFRIVFNDRRKGEKLTNSKLAEYVSKARPFLNLSNRQIQRLGEDIASNIKDEISKEFNK